MNAINIEMLGEHDITENSRVSFPEVEKTVSKAEKRLSYVTSQ